MEAGKGDIKVPYRHFVIPSSSTDVGDAGGFSLKIFDVFALAMAVSTNQHWTNEALR